MQQTLNKAEHLYSHLKTLLQNYFIENGKDFQVVGPKADYKNVQFLQVEFPNGSVFCNVELTREFLHDRQIDDIDKITGNPNFQAHLLKGYGKTIKIRSNLTMFLDFL